MNEVEEIKQHLDLAEIISGYLPLAKAGGANVKARCPFHQEKTPSFYVSHDKQMWHCFGCGEGGDVFTFVQKIEGLEFREALKLLADKAGVKLPEWRPEERSERERLLAALELAARFYAALLKDAPQAAGARAYLKTRGVSEEMIGHFGLGYAPDSWDALQTALLKRGVQPADLERAGMLTRRERGSGWYDRFRNRLMFPIRDLYGRIIGFTGRVLNPETKEAKYVNTPQTLLYNKSTALYGLDLARQAIRAEDLAVVVEGNMDAIACHQIGMSNVVAASGTALTAEQLRILARYTKNIAIAFDADPAGETAARRGIDLALAAGFTVRVIRLPPGAGKDPDECIKKDEAVWRAAVAGAVHFMDYLISALTEGRDLGDPAVKKQVGRALIGQIKKFPDAIEQTHWLQKVAVLLATPEAILREELVKAGQHSEKGRVGRGSGPVAEGAATPEPPPSRHRLLSESFLALLVSRPELSAAAIAALPPELLSDETIGALYKEAVAAYTQTGNLSVFRPKEHSGRPSDASSDALLRSLMLRGERDYSALTATAAEAEMRTILDALRELARSRQLEALSRDLRAAEARGDREAAINLARRVQEVVGAGG